MTTRETLIELRQVLNEVLDGYPSSVLAMTVLDGFIVREPVPEPELSEFQIEELKSVLEIDGNHQ